MRYFGKLGWLSLVLSAAMHPALLRGQAIVVEGGVDEFVFGFGALVRVAPAGPILAQGNDLLLPGVEPRITTVRRAIASEAAGVSDADFDVWLLDGLSSLGELRRLEGMLRLEVGTVAEVCGLTEDQKTKLRLAGEEDVRRFIESIEALRKRPRADLAPPELATLVDRLLAAKTNHEYDLLDEQSFFRKVLPKALDEEQLRRYERFDVERRQRQHEAQLVAVVGELDELLDLRDEQCRDLTRVLGEQTCLPRKPGAYDRDLILLQMAGLPQALSTFDADQQDDATEFLAKFRDEGPALRSLGLLSDTPSRPRAPVLTAAGKGADRAPAPTAPPAPPHDTLEALARQLEKANDREAQRPVSRPRQSWGSEQVEGPPDTPNAGDVPSAWASQTPDGEVEWLICRYAESVDLKAIEIHESFNPGAVVKVSAFNAANEEVKVWEGVDPTAKGDPRGVSIIPVKIGFKTSKVKIYIDSPAVPGFNEIDAVGLRDVKDDIQWARKVTASSNFPNGFPMQMLMQMRVQSRPPHSHEQVIGPPDTRHAGDNWTAWASQNPDDQEEWLICRYDAPMDIRGVIIHETFNPGAVTRVSVFDEMDNEIVVWEGIDPTPRTERMGVSIIPFEVPFKTARVKLHIDSPAVPGWNEIDAVAVRDAAGQTHWAQNAEASSTFGMARAHPAVPAAELQRIRRLEAEIRELRDELTRLKRLETEIEELNRLVKEPK